jgi:hypothetical protein
LGQFALVPANLGQQRRQFVKVGLPLFIAGVDVIQVPLKFRRDLLAIRHTLEPPGALRTAAEHIIRAAGL